MIQKLSDQNLWCTDSYLSLERTTLQNPTFWSHIFEAKTRGSVVVQSYLRFHNPM